MAPMFLFDVISISSQMQSLSEQYTTKIGIINENTHVLNFPIE